MYEMRICDAIHIREQFIKSRLLFATRDRFARLRDVRGDVQRVSRSSANVHPKCRAVTAAAISKIRHHRPPFSDRSARSHLFVCSSSVTLPILRNHVLQVILLDRQPDARAHPAPAWRRQVSQLSVTAPHRTDETDRH